MVWRRPLPAAVASGKIAAAEAAAATLMHRHRRLLRDNTLLLAAAALAALALASGRVTPRAALRAIDLDLLLVLFALLVAVELLRLSGGLDHAVAATVSRFHSSRTFIAALIVLSGALASLVTNDVTLFVMIPFTIAASRFSDFDVETTIVLEIIATNILGCLTPLGNPQNLFVFHRSGWSAAQFVMTMLPFVALSAAGLFVAVLLCTHKKPLAKTVGELSPVQRVPAIAGAVCFALVLLEIARVANAWPAAIAAAVCGVFILRKRLLEIDLSIVPLFFFAFVIVEGLRTMNLQRFVSGLYFSSIGLSQVISNVPATVLLSPMAAGRWKTLLYGVSAGGCGTIIASLANLLGWRIYVRESGREPRFLRRLTAFNFAFLIWCGAGGFLLLQRL